MRLASRIGTSSRVEPVSDTARPVMLVTLDVPFEAGATEIAIDTAVETGQPLLIVNAAEVPLGPISLAMKYEYVGTDEVEEALRAPAALAAGLAVHVERLRLCSPRPIDALLELVAERRPGLLVVGPDRARLKRRTYAKLVKRVLAGDVVPRLASRLIGYPRHPSSAASDPAWSSSNGVAPRAAFASNRDAGPCTPTMPTSSPRLSRTGAAIAARPSSRSSLASAKPRRRTRPSSSTSRSRVVIVRGVKPASGPPEAPRRRRRA